MIPNRLPCVIIENEWNQDRIHQAVGINPESGEICEVAAYGPKVGSQGYWMLQETCIEYSHALQDGQTPADLNARALRYEDGTPTSLRGVLIDTILEVESDYGA